MRSSPEHPASYQAEVYDLKLGRGLTLKKSNQTRIRVQFRILIRNLFLFTAGSTYLLFVFLSAFVVRRKTRSTGVASTIIGPRLVLEGFMNKEAIRSEFPRFCKEGPVDVFRKAELIICREAADSEEDERLLCVSEHPLVHLLKTNPPKISEVLRVLIDHFRLFVLFSRYCFTFPAFSFLYRDLLVFTTVLTLNRRGLIRDYVISNSEYYCQELWLNEFPGKSFSSHMLWYSSGFEWYKYKGEGEFIDSPENRYLSVDHHWVWTARQEACLRKTPYVRSITVAGPIMYYLPSSVEPERDGRTIAIFDMRPRQGWHFRQRYGKHIHYYNSGATVLAFMKDIVQQVEEIEQRLGVAVRLVLKSKRGVLSKHDRSYLAYIQLLEDTGRVELIHSQTNIFDVAKKSSGIIVLPFTSPGDIGAYVQTPTIYYDPTNTLMEPQLDHEYLDFAQDKMELGRFISRICRKMVIT